MHPLSRTLNRRRLVQAGITATLAGSAPSRHGAAQGTPATGEAIVTTRLGRIQGLRREGYTVFQGIPYAAPPVDDLRWVAPQPVEPWGSDILLATEPGPDSPQVSVPFVDAPETSEDCLYLNVWVPGTPEPDAGKPVLVFIHGGANLFGSGSEIIASRMAADEDVIVVTFNYRLGIFGAFGFPGLEDSGTFGLLDQLMVLEWVRDHIAAFGGDPGNVTLAGQSWGGLAVSAHLVSPLSAGLFHRAVIQSGVMLMDFPEGTLLPDMPALRSLWLTNDERNPASTSILEELGIDDTGDVVAQLRRLPTGLLAPLSPLFVPYVWGNRFLPEDPVAQTLAGKTHPVPVISGSNRDEARLIVTLTGGAFSLLDEDEYMDLLETAFGDDAAAIAAEYPIDAYPSGELAWAAVVTDRVWARPTLEQHRAYAAAQPTWAYEFRDREAPTGLFAVSGENGAGAYHSAELGYQFDMGDPAPLAASQRRLAAMMNRYWANFARTGDPNGAGLPAWPRYDGGSDVLGLDDEPGGVAPVDVVAGHDLEFWETRGAIPDDEE